MFKRLLFAICLSILPLSAIDYHKTHPEAWKATNINDAAMALYGTEKFSTIKQSDEIELIAPRALVKNPEQIPIEIYSSIPARSVALMVDKHDRALIDVFDQEGLDKIELSINIRLERKATLFVIIESKSGSLYYKRAYIDILCLPCMAN